MTHCRECDPLESGTKIGKMEGGMSHVPHTWFYWFVWLTFLDDQQSYRTAELARRNSWGRKHMAGLKQDSLWNSTVEVVTTEDEDCKVNSWQCINIFGRGFLSISFAYRLSNRGISPHPYLTRIWEKGKICWSEAAATSVTIIWCLMLIFKIHAKRCHYVTWQMHICSIQRDNVFPRFSSTIDIQRNPPLPLALYSSPTHPYTQTHTLYVCREGIKNMHFHEVLLYSTGNYIQSLGIDYDGR